MLTTNQQLITLGTVHMGKSYTFRYQIRNTSDKTLTVSRIYAGCSSCTEASLDTSVIHPGGNAYLNVTFTPNSTGAQTKTVTVYYNSGADSIKFKFTANVV